MELSQILQLTVVILSCLLVATVFCKEENQGKYIDNFSPSFLFSFRLSIHSVGVDFLMHFCLLICDDSGGLFLCILFIYF